MGRIAEEKLQQIRERVDIVEVVSRYLPLKRSGANHQGLCPFHGEKTPSFNVNSTRQIFHCFGCGVGGNVFSFLMRIEGLSFPEAARRLGEQVGIEIEEEQLTPAEEARRRELERLQRINEVAAEFYHRVLLEAPEGAPARSYLKRRGYDGEIARQFQLGFAPEGWEALKQHLESRGLDLGLARTLGLLREGKQGRGDYDQFRGRLMFPILDGYGKVAAFGGRVLDDSLPKYINSSESPVYHKGRTLYGLHQAKEGMRADGEVVVVEGYFDLLALAKAGLKNVVATCGTALTGEHARLLKRYAKRVVLLFDQDNAGRQATWRAMEALLPEQLSVAAAELDAGEDPDSFVARHGGELFRQRLAAARPVLEVFIEMVLAGAGGGAEATARAADDVLARLKLLPDEIERQLYLKELAARTGIDAATLARRARPERSFSPQAAPRAEPSAPATRPAPRPANRPDRLLRAQNLLLVLLLSDSEARPKALADGLEGLFADPDRRALAERLCALPAGAEAAALLDGEGLGEEQKAILSGILMEDPGLVTEDPERIFLDCRASVDTAALKQRSRELIGQIAAAEQDGDLARRDRLQQEFLTISGALRKR